MLDQTVWENIARSPGWGSRGAVSGSAPSQRQPGRGDGRGGCGSGATPTPGSGDLSGGNQQKVVFAKWMDAEPNVVVLDDPTRGVDVGVRAEMHGVVRRARRAGHARC